MSVSVVIAGGGTGGHVFPGLALAEAISEQVPDAEICFIGTERGMEKTLVPEAGFNLEMIRVLPYSKTLGFKRYGAPVSAIGAIASSRTILQRHGAHVVASMGGYASLPAAFAARSLRIPVVVHEQNAIPGRANRIAARLTHHVAASFPGSAARFPRPHDVVTVGNPIRKSLARLDRQSLRSHAHSHFGLDSQRRTLLISGGSQGAARLNEAAAHIAEQWACTDAGGAVLLLCGRGNHRELSAPSKSVEFTDRMDLAYAAADLVVARSGANVFEIAAAGLPSILVPYPYARDDHQRANAAWMQSNGAAEVIANEDATGESLCRVAEKMLGSEGRLATMEAAARRIAMPDAATNLAKIVLRCAQGAA